MKRQSKNFQSCPSFQITQPVLALAGEKKKKVSVAFLKMQKCGSRLGIPTTGIPRTAGLMGSVRQESRSSMWINVEAIISSSREYDKTVNGLKKIKLYSLAHPRNSSMQRIYQKKNRCWYCQSPRHRIWQGMPLLLPEACGSWERKTFSDQNLIKCKACSNCKQLAK